MNIHISPKHLEIITELRHRLHAHPELSMQERWTKKTLMEFIAQHTKLEISDRGNWFYAYYSCGKTDARPLGLRADFDALPMEESIELPYGSQNPGCSHKCGHDGHSAALAGAALELDAQGADRDVYLIFQHAEEIGGGGKECAELIGEKKIEQVYAFHNLSGYPKCAIAVCYGAAQCASEGFTVYFEGTPTHASQPEYGKNPSAAAAELVLFAQKSVTMNDFEGMVMVTPVQIAVGNRNFGIAAHKGEISMTLRADYEQDMMRLEQQIYKEAKRLAARDSLAVSCKKSDVFPDTVNHLECVENVKRAARANGLQVMDMSVPFRASEDFGYYLKKCPGAIFYIGNGESYAPLHTAAYDFNDDILKTAADMFLGII